MAMSNTEIQKAFKIKRTVVEYFETNTVTKIRAKDLMPDFVAKGIFDADDKDGLPIRDFLRKLAKEKYLSLIPQALLEQKEQNKIWFFMKSYGTGS